MSVEKLTIKGLRGFANEQDLRFAQPTGEAGSGITILVGPNNGGKSTVVESLQAWSARRAPTFPEGKRNQRAGDRVSIRIELDDGMHELRTIDTGGSQIIREPEDHLANCYVLPSRRFFDPYFNEGEMDRQSYLSSFRVPNTRSTTTANFSYRLFTVLKNLPRFNEVLARVVDPPPTWTIDQSDQGGYYLKMNSEGQFHSSDGLGEGIVSLLFIVDALYDSDEGDLIVIDEPELSLHPTYQRRLAGVLADFARSRQIVYATHSPYFVDFQHVMNGAEVARVHKRAESSRISQLDRSTAEQFKGLLRNSNNPHVLGLDAREVFFQEDGVVIVEGQDDVLRYPSILDQLVSLGRLDGDSASYLRERFFGWGAGGAGNIERVASLLHDLGFERVAGIFDKNQRHLIPSLQSKFGGYFFSSIPADDIRTKPATDGREATYGLIDESGELRSEHVQETGILFNKVGRKLRGTQN